MEVGLGRMLSVENWYPTKCAPGCVPPQRPLTVPLLRLVPGDCRSKRPPVGLSEDASQSIAADATLYVGVQFGAQQEVQLSVGHLGAGRPVYFLDFCGQVKAIEVLLYVRSAQESVVENGDLKTVDEIQGGAGGVTLGRGTFTSVDFDSGSRGAVTCKLRSEDGIFVGDCTFEYVAVSPFEGGMPLQKDDHGSAEDFCLSTAMSAEPMRPPLFAGHRGSGKTAVAAVRENTVSSFLKATSGDTVRSVELDVQLTKDDFPVVHHNWQNDDGEFVYNIPSTAVTDIPSLRKVCQSLPAEVGFLVEVKFPPPNVAEEKSIPYPDLNTIVDQTLRTLLCECSRENATRPLMILSFDADVCLMSKLKQTRIPVFMLHCETREPDCDDSDPRTMYIERGIDFARSQGMDGMVLLAEIVLEDESLPPRIHARGLSVLTYSDSNSKAEIALRQLQELNVDGVIADDVAHVAEKVCEHMPGESRCH